MSEYKTATEGRVLNPGSVGNQVSDEISLLSFDDRCML